MATEADPLGTLSESIADGESLDWDALRAAAPDEGARRLLDHLRIVAGVAEVHRSLVAETITASLPPRNEPPAAAGPQPAKWGHLLLVRKIGEGAYGEVYEALDTWLDHPRALKLLKPEVAGRGTTPQILHEARKLVRVRHPNVVMVHGADRHDGRVGFWMDLIEGQTLEQRVKEGRLSAGEAGYIGRELCRALSAVHQANLLHRDIKAQNVMRASDGGRIILMDFGAGEFRDAPKESRPHGTPLYLAPELLTGGAATIESDVYALGVLLFYLVSGRFPVEGTSYADLVLAHAQQRRQHLRDVRSDLPDGYVNVVERAIDPDPTRRFQSAGQFHAALEKGDGGRSHPALLVADRVDDRTRADAVEPASAGPASRRDSLFSIPLPSIGAIISAAIVVVLVVLLFGVVASRAFEVALHVRPGFRAGPLKFLDVGTWGLSSFLMLWALFSAATAMLLWSRVLFASTVDRIARPITSRLASTKAATLAALVALVGILWWAGITWWYADMFSAMFAMQSGRFAGPDGTPLLNTAFRAMHKNYGLHAAILSFVLLFSVWRWWPGLERRAEDPAFVRAMKWAPIAICMLALVCVMVPRRLVWEQFQVVLYKNQDSFVIGTSGDELLLFTNDGSNANPRIVRRDSPEVQSPDPGRWQFIVPR